MSGWHDPEKVNKYFSCFSLPYAIYGSDEIERLKTLWQLRHSIVHTGGTLTFADAQKVKSLHGLGGRNIALENNFIFEVSRKLHPLVKSATVGIGKAFKTKSFPNLPTTDLDRINSFFEVKSSVSVWLLQHNQKHNKALYLAHCK